VTNRPKSGAIYGGVAGGMSAEADEFIRAVMADMMDQQPRFLLHERRTLSQYRLGNGRTEGRTREPRRRGSRPRTPLVETTYTSDGGATQDPELWWTLICESTRRLLGRTGVTKERVKAVRRHGSIRSTVPVDANGVPTGPA